MTDLVNRISRLERESRRMKGGILAGVVLLGGVFLMGQVAQQKIPDVFKVKSFELIDKNGRRRAWLKVDGHGVPDLTFFSKKGREKLVIGLMRGMNETEPVPGLYFYDQHEKRRILLTLLHDGSPRLTFMDDKESVIWKAP